MDRSVSDKIRLTLDEVVLERTPLSSLPRRVRVALHGQGDIPVPAPGSRVLITGHLGPPPFPAEPGGFEFARHSWFQGLGGVGYTRNPAFVLDPPSSDIALAVFQTRMWISEALQDALPGPTGAVAAAIVVGDRSAMPLEVVTDLRLSLIHI